MGKKAIAILCFALVLGAVGYVMVRVQSLAPGYTQLRAYMDDASGLMDGTQVRLNGIPIGYLNGQNLTNSKDLNRKVEFDLKVKTSYLRDIPVDSVVGLASDNLLGDQYIGITRGTSAQHVEPGAELRIKQSTDLPRMMAQMSRQLDRLQAVVERADRLTAGVAKGSGAIGKIVKDPTLKTAAGAGAELDQLIADVQHGSGTLTKLFYEDPLAAQLQGPKQRLDEIMGSVDSTSAKLKDFQAEVDRATAEFRSLQAELNSGNGAASRLEHLQAQVDQLTGKIDGMMQRVNSGQGTVGQLMVNPQLNEALAGTQREFQEFARNVRTNPRKSLAIKIF